jgi:predicted lipoprotein with Yx(FWY)xxD motif
MIRRPALVLAVAVTAGIAACSSGANPTAAPTQAPAPTSAPSAAAGGATVNATAVGSAGTILVDAKTGMTLYTFSKDVKDSGTSACTAACLETWPALTVNAGETPTGGTGVSGTLGTITRADNGALQVTYNGLPLYFFQNDKAPGDLNGVYENWQTVPAS